MADDFFDLSSPKGLRESLEHDEFVKALRESDYFEKITLTDANGTIIASDNNIALNTPLLADNHWQTAIGGISVSSEFNPKDSSIKFYLPIKAASEATKGVVIVSAVIPESLQFVNGFTVSVVATMLGAAFLFIVISYFVMTELEEKMNLKERSATDKSKALSEERQMYEAITASIAEALIVINNDGQIILFNKEAEKITGHTSEKIEFRYYKKLITFYNEDGKKYPKDLISDSLKTGKRIKATSKDRIYMKNSNGELFPVAISISPISDSETFIKGVAVTIADLSAEIELQKMKDEFVYVVAHELGNPIFALDGYLSIVENKKFDKETKEMIKDAKRINSDLSSLVNDLLEVARNETGRLTFEISKFDINQVICEVIENSVFKARKKNISIDYKSTKTPDVLGNEKKIKEVMTNLIDNAIKYTPNKGKVNIRTKKINNYLEVSVADNGIGLTKEEQKHLFEKFYRAKNKNTESITGTGLGLFIAKQIVEKCGGSISAESTAGKGSIFTVNLKLSK